MEEKKLMEFKHPKYYKELRKLRNNLDQAISGKNSTECKTRSPGPGLKQQASSTKPQAASSLILEPRNKKTEKVFLGKGPRAFTMINVLSGCFTWNAI